MSSHAAGHTPRGHGRKFSPQNWERLVSDERRRLLDPDRFLERIGVRAGTTVADLGAGPGFFTLPLAQRVGSTGVVYATDVSPEMVRLLESRGLPSHVRVLRAEESRFEIPDAAVDLALLAFVLHELVHPVEFLREARRTLRPGGQLVALEWVPQEEAMGPPLQERLSEQRSTELIAAAGLRVIERGDANRSNYYLVASRDD